MSKRVNDVNAAVSGYLRDLVFAQSSEQSGRRADIEWRRRLRCNFPFVGQLDLSDDGAETFELVLAAPHEKDRGSAS